MLDWIHNSHAGFVLAAYGVAAVALIGLALASWRDYACRARQLKKLGNDT